MGSLQYPQRMDGLCSQRHGYQLPPARPLAVSSADGRALQQRRCDQMAALLTDLAVSSADGRALQRLLGFADIPHAIRPCSILSGWTGFAAKSEANHPSHAYHLQYPQRMDGLCSFKDVSHLAAHLNLQYPQRMDGLCSAAWLTARPSRRNLAVSSADGRALQQ